MESLDKFNSKEIEERILAWWEKEKIYEEIKANEPTEEDKKFFFLDGPPYTTGNVHLGTAWNKIMKDYIIRYKRMQGLRVTDTPGYDTHGLPIEVVTEKKLGMKNKKDIEEYGLDKFIEQCKSYAESKIPSMNDQFKRLGCTFWNWDNPYITYKNTYIQGIWWTLKKAWENNYLYQFYKPQNCCPRCSTALAKHEYEYHDIEDTAIFVKFKVVDEPDTYLVIWTTTPWTLVSNTNIMANPDLEYVKMRVKDEHWIMGIASTADLLQNKMGLPVNDPEGFSYGERYTGYDLEGMKYVHPLAEEVPYQAELEKQEPKVHTVILSREYVQEGGGSGLVHSAPGHGPEDFEVGVANGIPVFSPVDMNGEYTDKAGKYEGKYVHGVNEEIMDLLADKGTLIFREKISHEYAHCWRCKTKLVYRATRQWFFRTSALRDKMLKENEEIFWIPEYAGNTNFKSWLTTLNDWCISRQRYWGIPLSIWICDNKDCDHMHVIGSTEELKEKAGKVPEDLHKPWIDEITWKCPECGNTMRRTPDVLDVWLDSGSVMWASQKFIDGHEHYDTWKAADFIIEGKDQIRGWFNSLLCSAMVSSQRRNYNACYMHGWVLAHGVKMSKSLGNSIEPEDIIEGKVEILNANQKEKLRKLAAAISTSKFDKTKEKEGVKSQNEMRSRKKQYLKDNPRWSNVNGIETFRFYSVMATPPGKDFNFDYKEYTDVFRTMNTLWNVYKFAQEKMELNNFDPKDHPLEWEKLNPTDQWMLSYTNSTIGKLTELYEKYELPSIPATLQDYILNDLSRWYITIIRDWVDINNEDPSKFQTLSVLWYVLHKLTLVLAPSIPMIAEEIYQKMFRPVLPNLTKKSVHLTDWPQIEEQFVNKELEEQMKLARKIIDTVRSVKHEEKVKLRWTTKSLMILKDKEAPDIIFTDLIKEMSNVKYLEFVEESPDGEHIVATKLPKYRLFLDLSDSKELQQDRILADLLRGIQYLRKRAKLQMGEDIHLILSTDHPFLYETLQDQEEEIATHVFANPLEIVKEPISKEKGWTTNDFYVCVNDSCYSMIRSKHAHKIKNGKDYKCRYCENKVDDDTLGEIDIKFKKK